LAHNASCTSAGETPKPSTCHRSPAEICANWMATRVPRVWLWKSIGSVARLPFCPPAPGTGTHVEVDARQRLYTHDCVAGMSEPAVALPRLGSVPEMSNQ